MRPWPSQKLIFIIISHAVCYINVSSCEDTLTAMKSTPHSCFYNIEQHMRTILIENIAYPQLNYSPLVVFCNKDTTRWPPGDSYFQTTKLKRGTDPYSVDCSCNHAHATNKGHVMVLNGGTSCK